MHHSVLAGPRRRSRRALLAAALPAVLAAVALPAAADAASSASISGVDLAVFSPGSAENNSIVVEDLPDARIRVIDASGVTAGAGCVQSSRNTAACTRPNRRIFVTAGAGDDILAVRTGVPTTYVGGDGADRFRAQAGPFITSNVSFFGGTGHDAADYSSASRAVTVTNDEAANDGRPGRADRDNIHSDVEELVGSSLDDTLRGGSGNELIRGGPGNDTLRGFGGNDLFVAESVADGAEFISGDAGTNTMTYQARTQPVHVNLSPSLGSAGNGQLGENDQLVNIHRAVGGSGNDTLETPETSIVPVTLEGGPGNDTLNGGAANDTLFGSVGQDTMAAKAGDDVLFAVDGQFDLVGCGSGSDTAHQETGLDVLSGCENLPVGVLRLTPKAVKAQAGKPVQLDLSWRVPKTGRKLRKIELRLTRDGLTVGEIAIRPRGERIAADGAVKLVRKQTRLTRKGKTVSARLAVRLDESLAGQTLKAEVEATDVRGARQLERNAGTVGVAR